MFIIIDKNTNKIKQTISTNYNIQLDENYLLQEVDNKFIEKFTDSYEYELIFKDGKLTDIKTLKTWRKWEIEQRLNLPIVEEKVDTEKVAMAAAIVDLNNRIVQLETKLLEREDN